MRWDREPSKPTIVIRMSHLEAAKLHDLLKRYANVSDLGVGEDLVVCLSSFLDDTSCT